MILAVSRFRVANGMEEPVRDAFLKRPHLVDTAPGFLGMEVFTDRADPAVFYLVTRWTDEPSFRRWHASEEHHLSHRGIPRGLKLDPSFTRIRLLDRIEAEGVAPVWEEQVADHAPLLGSFLAHSRSVCWLQGSRSGSIAACNEALAALLGREVAQVVGTEIWEHLVEADRQPLRERLHSPRRRAEESFLLNLVDRDQHPFTLECRLEVQPEAFTLLGELPTGREHALQEELLALNNQLAVLARESARKSKLLEKTATELKQALEELDASYWHLKKIQEWLPICMRCSRVRTSEAGEAAWENVAEFLKKHSRFLTHGFCPECERVLREEWGLPPAAETKDE